MVAITKLIMIGIAVVCAVTLAFIVLEFVEDKVISKFSKKDKPHKVLCGKGHGWWALSILWQTI